MSCERKSGNRIGRYEEWFAIHQVLAGNVTHDCLLGTTTKLSMLFHVLGLLVVHLNILLRLSLAVTSKKYRTKVVIRCGVAWCEQEERIPSYVGDELSFLKLGSVLVGFTGVCYFF